MGHSTVDVTQNIYTGTWWEQRAAAVQGIGALIWGNKTSEQLAKDYENRRTMKHDTDINASNQTLFQVHRTVTQFVQKIQLQCGPLVEPRTCYLLAQGGLTALPNRRTAPTFLSLARQELFSSESRYWVNTPTATSLAAPPARCAAFLRNPHSLCFAFCRDCSGPDESFN